MTITCSSRSEYVLKDEKYLTDATLTVVVVALSFLSAPKPFPRTALLGREALPVAPARNREKERERERERERQRQRPVTALLAREALPLAPARKTKARDCE